MVDGTDGTVTNLLTNPPIIWKQGDMGFWNNREFIIINVSTKKKNRTAFITFQDDGSSHNKPLSELRPPYGIGGTAEVHNHHDSPGMDPRIKDSDRAIVDQQGTHSIRSGATGGSGVVPEREIGRMDKGEGEDQDSRDDNIRVIMNSQPIPDIEQRSDSDPPAKRRYIRSTEGMEVIKCPWGCGREDHRFKINRHAPKCHNNPAWTGRSQSGPIVTTNPEPPHPHPSISMPEPETPQFPPLQPGHVDLSGVYLPHEHEPGLSVCFRCRWEGGLEVMRTIEKERQRQ